MHILAIPSFFPPMGGAFCLDQARALVRHGGHQMGILAVNQVGITQRPKLFLTMPLRLSHSSIAVTPGNDDPETSALPPIHVVSGWVHGLPRAPHLNMRRWVNEVRHAYDIYVERYGKPHLLHAHCCKWGGYAAMTIARENGIPYVITEHLSLQLLTDEIHPPYEQAWQTPLMREAYRKAALVIPVARELVDNIAPIVGRDYSYSALSNTIDTHFFHARSRHSSSAPYRFCCLAINEPLKGYDVLYRAFSMVIAQHPDAELHVAGAGTQNLPDAPGVVRHGELTREAVRELLYTCHCLVLASRSEAQPLVILEAMATGIPVISTTVMPDSIRLEGVTDVVAIDDAEAFARAMIRRMQSPMIDPAVPSAFVSQIASPEAFAERFTALVTPLITNS